MNRFIKGAALFALIACSVWVAVLWRWQATARDIGSSDIVTYLGALPVTVFVFALLLRWAWRGAAAGPVRSNAAVPVGKVAAPSPGDAAPPRAAVHLLAAHVVCAAGDSAAALESAAHAGQPRPTLDALLQDEDGFPVTVARIAGLGIGPLRAQLDLHATAARGQRAAWAAEEVGEHVLRALAALEHPLVQTVGSLPAPPERVVEQRVRVLLGCAANWTAFEQEVARAVLGDWLGGDIDAKGPAGDRFAITVHAGTGEELLLHADRLLQTLAREQLTDLVIVAACHSALSQSAVDALESAGSLFHGQKQPRRQIPGEAAAALLLSVGDRHDPSETGVPRWQLQRPALLRRDQPVDTPGRVSHEALVRAITEALAASGIDAGAVASVVCDADLHTARSPEFFGAAIAHLAHLDSQEDMRLIAPVTGATGVVSPLLVIATAAERVSTTVAPCLALALGDAVVRLAVVVSPAANTTAAPPHFAESESP